MSRGIITAMDDNAVCFSSFKLLYASLKIVSPELPLTMVDLGLTYEQRSFIESLPGVNMMELSEVQGPLPFPADEKAPRWHSWNKPCYMRSSPYEESVWLDVDCILFRPVEGLYPLAVDHLRVVEDCAAKAFPAAIVILPNRPYTYAKYPVRWPLPDGPFVNTGVLSFRPHRDYYFFDKWIAFTYKCHDDLILRESISWWDQGVCQYIIEENGWSRSALCDIRWNHAAPFKGLRKPSDEYGGPLEFIKTLEPRDTIIGHFAGYPKPWGDLTDTPIHHLQDLLRPHCRGYY